MYTASVVTMRLQCAFMGMYTVYAYNLFTICIHCDVDIGARIWETLSYLKYTANKNRPNGITKMLETVWKMKFRSRMVFEPGTLFEFEV